MRLTRLPRRLRSNLFTLFPTGLVLTGLMLTGCGGPEVEEFKYINAKLTPDQLERAVARVDELYAPPRTVARVTRSIEVCMGAITRESKDEIPWRAARSSVWLAEHVDDPQLRNQVALQGAQIGRRAVRESPERVEPHYWYANALGRLSEIHSTPTYLDRMVEMGTKALEIDASYDFGGPHRFLGLIYLETENQPVYAVGSFDEALEHLERACEIAPDYPPNHLAFARALIEDDRYKEAHERLIKVLELPAPAGEEVDRAEWIAAAKRLLQEIAG